MPNLDIALKEALAIEGAQGVALVDSASGMALGTAGAPPGIDLNVAAAGNTDVVRAKLRAMQSMNINDVIEDILITLGSAYHLIRPLRSPAANGLFLYLVLDKQYANLAMARHKLAGIEAGLEI